MVATLSCHRASGQRFEQSRRCGCIYKILVQIYRQVKVKQIQTLPGSTVKYRVAKVNVIITSFLITDLG